MTCKVYTTNNKSIYKYLLCVILWLFATKPLNKKPNLCKTQTERFDLNEAHIPAKAVLIDWGGGNQLSN